MRNLKTIIISLKISRYFFQPVAFPVQVLVNLGELADQRVLAVLVLLDQHQLELAVDVLDDPGYFFILSSYKVTVTKGDSHNYKLQCDSS